MVNRRILTEVNHKLETVWKNYSSQIYKLCVGWSDSREGADDLFQEVALKFCTSSYSMDLNGNLFQWFSTVVENAHHDVHRHWAREVSVSRLSERRAVYDVAPQKAATFHDDEKALNVQSELDFLMTNLTEEERRLVTLTFFEGLSLQEMSDLMHSTWYRLKKRRTGAVSKMKEMKKVRDELFKKKGTPVPILEDLLT